MNDYTDASIIHSLFPHPHCLKSNICLFHESTIIHQENLPLCTNGTYAFIVHIKFLPHILSSIIKVVLVEPMSKSDINHQLILVCNTAIKGCSHTTTTTTTTTTRTYGWGTARTIERGPHILATVLLQICSGDHGETSS